MTTKVISKTISGEQVLLSLQENGSTVHNIYLAPDDAKGFELNDVVELTLVKAS